MMKAKKRTGTGAGQIFEMLGLPIVMLVVIAIFGFLDAAFLSPENISSMIRSASIAAIMFLGLTWVFAVGEIDISFVSVTALVNMIAAGLVSAGYGWEFSLLAGFSAGIMIGICNGYLVAYLGLPSLVTTIAVGGIAAALAAAIGKGYSISLQRAEQLDFVTEMYFGPIPLLAVVAGVLFCSAWWIQERLALGQYIYAIANNRSAVVEAGIPARWIVFLLFVFSATCSAFAGALLTIELTSGQPSIAGSFFLDGLTAVLLGGTMLKIGKPNVIGTMVSVLILAVLVRGGALQGWADSTFQIVKGVLLLIGISSIMLLSSENKGGTG